MVRTDSDSESGWGAPLERALAALRRQLWIRAFCEALALALPILLFVSGVWILCARFLFDATLPVALWGLACLPLALVFAVWRAQRAVPDDARLAATLDQQAGGTGVLLTQLELHDARWQGQAQRVWATAVKPRLEPQVGNGLWGSFFAGLFIAAALLFAPPAPADGLPVGLLTRNLARIADEVASFEELGLLDEERQAELQQRLEAIAETLAAGGLEQAFESLDRFGEDLERLAAEHADALGQLRDLADRLGAGDREDLSAALASMSQSLGDPATQALLREALQAFGAHDLGAHLDAETLGAFLAGLESTQALEGLSEQLSEQFVKRMGELAARGMIDPEALAAALRRERWKPARKADAAEHASDCAVHSGGFCDGGAAGTCSGAGRSGAGQPGSGGVSRGPGAADLSLGAGSELKPELFESQTLNGAPLPDDSTLISVDFQAPEEAPQGEAAGLIDVQGSTGSVTWKRRLSPTQRDAVRRFFTPTQGSDL